MRTVLSFSNVSDLFPHKFARLSGRRFSFALRFPSEFQRFLFRHNLFSNWSYFAHSYVGTRENSSALIVPMRIHCKRSQRSYTVSGMRRDVSFATRDRILSFRLIDTEYRPEAKGSDYYICPLRFSGSCWTGNSSLPLL